MPAYDWSELQFLLKATSKESIVKLFSAIVDEVCDGKSSPIRFSNEVTQFAVTNFSCDEEQAQKFVRSCWQLTIRALQGGQAELPESLNKNLRDFLAKLFAKMGAAWKQRVQQTTQTSCFPALVGIVWDVDAAAKHGPQCSVELSLASNSDSDFDLRSEAIQFSKADLAKVLDSFEKLQNSLDTIAGHQ